MARTNGQKIHMFWNWFKIDCTVKVDCVSLFLHSLCRIALIYLYNRSWLISEWFLYITSTIQLLFTLKDDNNYLYFSKKFAWMLVFLSFSVVWCCKFLIRNAANQFRVWFANGPNWFANCDANPYKYTPAYSQWAK